jgi:hypothetical protein
MSVLLRVVSDGFHRTAEKGFFTFRALFVSQGLLVDKRITVFVRAFKVLGGGIAANVAIDAGGVYVVGSGNILFHAVVTVGHNQKSEIRGQKSAVRGQKTRDAISDL